MTSAAINSLISTTYLEKFVQILLSERKRQQLTEGTRTGSILGGSKKNDVEILRLTSLEDDHEDGCTVSKQDHQQRAALPVTVHLQ